MTGRETQGSSASDSPYGPDRDGVPLSREALADYIARKRPNPAQYANMIRSLGPQEAFEISTQLYQKAQTQNSELSEDEVRCFLLF
jgi:hypothetical protein